MLNHANGKSFGIMLLIGITLAMFVVMPIWLYSKKWGLRPSCVVAFFIAVVMFLLQTGEL